MEWLADRTARSSGAEYLFDGMNINNNNIDSGDDGNNNHHTGQMMHSSSTNSLVDIADILAVGAASPSPQQPTAAAKSAATGRNLQESPQRSAERRVRLIMTRHRPQPSQSWGYITTTWCDGHDGDKGTSGSGAYSLVHPVGGRRIQRMSRWEHWLNWRRLCCASSCTDLEWKLFEGWVHDAWNEYMLGLLMMKGEGEDSDDANKDFMNTSSLSPTSNLLPITTLDERKSRYSTLDAAQFYCLQHSCQSRHSASHVQHVDPFRRNDTVWVYA